jgi:hypothetical protein
VTTALKDRWNPYQVFTVGYREVTDWIDTFGSNSFYDGRLWRPVTKKLIGGRNAKYEVRFEEVK